jgi:tetratricopeptide (TPR) repeat protein
VVLRFLKDFPKGSDAIAIKYRLGALYYYYNQFDRALLSFQDIIKTAPSTKFAEYSANLTLDIYNLKNDYEGLEKAGQEILSIPQLAASPVGAQVQSILEKSSFKRAQNMEAGKDFLSSAKQFESFSNKNGRSELATSARFNSAVNYERAGDLLKALAMYGSVLKGSGKGHDDLKQKSLKFMALLYEKSGQYKEAAEFFEKYANENAKGDKDAVDFFYNAGVIRDGMNFFNAALDNYQKYFDRSKRRDRMEVVFLMAKIWQKRGNLKNARSYYSQYVDLNTRYICDRSGKISLDDAKHRLRPGLPS